MAEDPVRLLRGIRSDGSALPLVEHDRLHGVVPDLDAATLVAMVEASGLLGRGGAAFPLVRKMLAVAAHPGPAVVVANGAEGEPASAKDSVLGSRHPHLVIDGAVVAAAAVGADRVFVAAKGRVVESYDAAASARVAARRDRVRVEVVAVPDGFVTGQETALVDAINGGPGRPTLVPPRLCERGVSGRPTLVSNVETLAHLALIARWGPQWFRAIGTRRQPGSTLVSVRGAVHRPGVHEIACGTPLEQLVDRAGGPTGPQGPVLVGGYAGAWLSAPAAARARLDEEDLAAAGATLGAGVVIPMDPGICGIAVTADLLSYLARESAGQCGPCVHGLAAMAGAMQELAEGRAGRDVVQRLESWAWQVTGRGACRHPDGAARLTASALAVFRDDVAGHVRGRPCPGSSAAARRALPLPGLAPPRRRVGA